MAAFFVIEVLRAALPDRQREPPRALLLAGRQPAEERREGLPHERGRQVEAEDLLLVPRGVDAGVAPVAYLLRP